MGALLQLRLLCFALLGLLLATTGTFASIRACHAGEHAFLAANSTGPALATAAVSTTQGSSTESSTRLALIPPAAVQPTYDLDGNLLQDGLWSFLWDGSNRLIQMESLPSWPAGANRLKLRFAYDAAGRRIHKQVFQEVNLNGSKTYVLKLDRRFLYDGWNLIAELDPDGSPARTYLWGTDLSGSAQGAGGVGGLLAIHILKGPASAVGVHFPFYDGNGNVTGLTSAATGMETARYSYDAFGVELRASGPAAQANPFHFSTKFTDEESGLVYFGFRYYDPSAGRWLSRDPIGEQGGVNLYGMVRNDPVNSVDVLGLSPNPNSVVSPADVIQRIRNQFEKVAKEVANSNSNFTLPFGSTSSVDANVKALKVLTSVIDTGGIDDGSNLFVYSCKCGWIDVGHVMQSAMIAAFLKNEVRRVMPKVPNPGGVAAALTALGSYGVEIHQATARATGARGPLWEALKRIDGGRGAGLQDYIRADVARLGLGGDGWSASSFTIEDLPSNLMGAQLGAGLNGPTGRQNWHERFGFGEGYGEIEDAVQDIESKLTALFQRCSAVNPTGRIGEFLRADAKYYSQAGSAGGPYYPGDVHNFTFTPQKTRSHDCVCRGQ